MIECLFLYMRIDVKQGINFSVRIEIFIKKGELYIHILQIIVELWMFFGYNLSWFKENLTSL